MISRRQLALAAITARRPVRLRVRQGGAPLAEARGRNWIWLVYAVAAFAIGIGLSFCAVQVLETAARVAT